MTKFVSMFLTGNENTLVQILLQQRLISSIRKREAERKRKILNYRLLKK